MVKKHIYLFTLLIVLNINAQTENSFKNKFIYKLTYQPDIKDVNSKISEEMLLLTNKNFSFFLSKNNFTKDSLLFSAKINNIKADRSKFSKTRFFYKILKDYTKDSITVYDEIFMDNYKYKESKKNIKWNIRTDILTINGFKCQKATTNFSGRHYEAWFSNEIPISDGPYKFSGLPGLIIKISDSNNHYVFELIDQSNINESYPYLKPTRNHYITKKSIFLKKQKEFKDNLVMKMSQSGFTLDKKHTKRIKERQKKRNNPIELGKAWYLDQ